MAISQVARASEVIMNDGLRRIPGLDGKALNEFPFMLHSGLLDLVSAVAHQAPHMIPFDATIVAIRTRIKTIPGTGDAIVKVGTLADDDKFLAQTISTDTNVNAASAVLTGTILNSGTVSAGDVITFSADGGATSTGDVDVTLVLVPR